MKKINFKNKKSVIKFAFLFVSILVVIAWLALCLPICFQLRSLIRISNLNVEEKEALVEGVDYYDKYSPRSFNSFFDSFSNLSNVKDIDNLYYDEDETAITFPPDFSVSSVSSYGLNNLDTDFSDIYLNNFSWLFSDNNEDVNKFYDKRCIGNNCLEQKGRRLFYNNKLIYLPSFDKSDVLKAISLGVLQGENDGTFIVGFTVLNKNKYKGIIYLYNGKNFVSFKELNIVSNYPGLFGFGGDSDDFLMIYESYRGQAFRVIKNNEDWNIYDVSQFFDYRISGDGFRPEVIKVFKEGNPIWYVFSSSYNTKKLVKLWENEGEINGLSGAISYRDIFDSNSSSARFKLLDNYKDNAISLLFYQGGSNYKIFSDFGFKNEDIGELMFKKIPNTTDETNIKIRDISKLELTLDSSTLNKGDFGLFFSQIDSIQSEIAADMEGDFNFHMWYDFLSDSDLIIDENILGMYIKIVFNSLEDKFESPFLTEFIFNYRYSKI